LYAVQPRGADQSEGRHPRHELLVFLVGKALLRFRQVRQRRVSIPRPLRLADKNIDARRKKQDARGKHTANLASCIVHPASRLPLSPLLDFTAAPEKILLASSKKMFNAGSFRPIDSRRRATASVYSCQAINPSSTDLLN
jgi:hypothetical protein